MSIWGRLLNSHPGGLIFIFSYVKIHKDYPEVRESGERSY
jgi:hypothetical protein